MIEDDNPDRVRGVVHNNSLARLYMNAGPDTSIEPAIRDVPIFPETKPLDDLLAELQRQRSSIAVVSDEYGRTVGIVTVEDILEEVVGEIEDETDPRATSMRQLTDGDWYVRGHVSLGDLEDVGIQLPVSSDAFNSIGGYVFSELGRLPKRGDRIKANGYEIRVESVRENRIVAVRIHASADRRISPPAPGTGEAANRAISGVQTPGFRPQAALGCDGPAHLPKGRAMWVVKLTDKQLEVLRAVLRAEEHLGPALRGALEALDLARWDDLPEAELPWDDVASGSPSGDLGGRRDLGPRRQAQARPPR